MTRFVNKQLNTLGALLFCALASVLLQGCGAERTTPFDPDTSSSSSSSSVTKIDVNEEASGTQPFSSTIDHKDKSLNVMRSDEEYNTIANFYVDHTLDDVSFTAGQVVLVDMGETNDCDRHLDFSSLTAQEDGDNSIRVVVKYNERAENLANCSGTTRPYYFYYIDQRGPIIFEEKIL